MVLLPANSFGLFEESRIFECITSHAEELALVFLGGVNYYTGQVLPMEAITAHCHQLVLLPCNYHRAF